jgi:hypothetical protein
LQADLLWAQSPFRRRFHPKKDQIHRAWMQGLDITLFDRDMGQECSYGLIFEMARLSSADIVLWTFETIVNNIKNYKLSRMKRNVTRQDESPDASWCFLSLFSLFFTTGLHYVNSLEGGKC